MKKEIRASLCPLQPDAGKEEKEKKKKKKEEEEEEGEGEYGGRGSRRTCGPRRAFVKGRRTARSLGAPFTTMI